MNCLFMSERDQILPVITQKCFYHPMSGDSDKPLYDAPEFYTFLFSVHILSPRTI